MTKLIKCVNQFMLIDYRKTQGEINCRADDEYNPTYILKNFAWTGPKKMGEITHTRILTRGFIFHIYFCPVQAKF